MALDDLKDQLKEKLTEAWGKVQESPAYNTLREKYETMSPGSQLGLILGTGIIVFLMIVYIPYSYYSSSSDYEMEFSDSRSLIRDLLRASRVASDVASLPQTTSSAELRSRIQTMLQNFTLQPEQIGPVLDIDAKTLNFAGVISAPSIRQEGLGISLKKLNLKQAVDIGFELQRISPSAKMAGMEINAGAPDPHYFDVLYKMIVFNVPNEEEPANDNTKGPRNKRPIRERNRPESTNSKSPSDEETAGDEGQ